MINEAGVDPTKIIGNNNNFNYDSADKSMKNEGKSKS